MPKMFGFTQRKVSGWVGISASETKTIWALEMNKMERRHYFRSRTVIPYAVKMIKLKRLTLVTSIENLTYLYTLKFTSLPTYLKAHLLT